MVYRLDVFVASKVNLACLLDSVVQVLCALEPASGLLGAD